MISSGNRYPLFGIMRWTGSSASRTGVELNVEVGKIRPPSRESRREAERDVP